MSWPTSGSLHAYGVDNMWMGGRERERRKVSVLTTTICMRPIFEQETVCMQTSQAISKYILHDSIFIFASVHFLSMAIKVRRPSPFLTRILRAQDSFAYFL